MYCTMICSSSHPPIHNLTSAALSRWMGGIGDSLEFLPPLTRVGSTLAVQWGTPSVSVEALGYQEKIAGTWSATAKAIDLKLCDRKPVETGSRTQKDQLLWSTDVLAILKEHTPAIQ